MTDPVPADDVDAVAVRVAAARTAWQIAGVAGAVVIAVFGLAVVFVIDQSRPSELLERPAPGESKIYIDSSEALLALAVLGVLAVLIVGIASWRISRRAVLPLGTALRIQRSFVADASHELRTPLTVLDTRLQVLERQVRRGEPVDETVRAVRGDTRMMIDLVTDLLLLAEGSAGGDSAAGRECDLRPTVTAAVDGVRPLAEQRSIDVVVEVLNEARVGCTELSLHRSLVVLLDNAIVHTPAGGAVRVIARRVRGTAVIDVVDSGSGIQGIEPARVFDRFAHGATTGRRRGFGIGLALARDLAVRHGGSLGIAATAPTGTTMRLSMPLARS